VSALGCDTDSGNIIDGGGVDGGGVDGGGVVDCSISGCDGSGGGFDCCGRHAVADAGANTTTGTVA